MTPLEIMTTARLLGAKFAIVHSDKITFIGNDTKTIDEIAGTISRVPMSGTKYDGFGQVISTELHRNLLLMGAPCAFFQGYFADEIGTFNIK